MADFDFTSIRVHVPTPAIFEQLAEECTELAHAALKVARTYRRENPTPVTMVEAVRSVYEEFTDVMTVAYAIGLKVDDIVMEGKLERWHQRLEEQR